MSQLFNPKGDTLCFDVDDTGVAYALPRAVSASGSTIRIFNDSESVVFITFGDDEAVAEIPADGEIANGFPLAPGRETGLSTSNEGETYIAAICKSGETATLYVSCGNGI